MVLSESNEKLEIGSEAPQFKLIGTDRNWHTLEDFVDYKILLICFTCNHCPYAQAKVPVLNRLAEEYSEMAVVGISSNDVGAYPEDSLDMMIEWVENGKILYDYYLYDENQSAAKDYGAECTPDPFLFVSNGGKFVLEYHGRLDDATDPKSVPKRHEMREVIDKYLMGEKWEGTPAPAIGCGIKWKQ